ncbi:hypothetical protein BD560DRAFT_381112 [Blakeslea trispora]|nr:hypothetical protein BD560DRAFT_381112 [Blakeslea trispora]
MDSNIKAPSGPYPLSERHQRRLEERRKPGTTFCAEQVRPFEPVLDASYAIDAVKSPDETDLSNSHGERTKDHLDKDRSSQHDQPTSYIAEANWSARLHDIRPGMEFGSKHHIPAFRPQLVLSEPQSEQRQQNRSTADDSPPHKLPRKRPLEEEIDIGSPEKDKVNLASSSSAWPSNKSPRHARQRSASIASIHSILSAKSAPPAVLGNAALTSAILSKQSPSFIREESSSLTSPHSAIARSVTGSIKSMPDLTKENGKKPDRSLQHFSSLSEAKKSVSIPPKETSKPYEGSTKGSSKSPSLSSHSPKIVSPVSSPRTSLAGSSLASRAASPKRTPSIAGSIQSHPPSRAMTPIPPKEEQDLTATAIAKRITAELVIAEDIVEQTIDLQEEVPTPPVQVDGQDVLFQFEDDMLDGDVDVDDNNGVVAQQIEPTTSHDDDEESRASIPLEESSSFLSLIEELRTRAQRLKTTLNKRCNIADLHIDGLIGVAEEVVVAQGERERDPFKRDLLAKYFTTFKSELLKHKDDYRKYEEATICRDRARTMYNKTEKRMIELKRQERILETEIEKEKKQMNETRAKIEKIAKCYAVFDQLRELAKK